MSSFLFDKMFWRKAMLGLRYVGTYFADELTSAHNRGYSMLKPLDIVCDITHSCNLKCLTCFRWTSVPDPNELTFEQWKGVIEKLKAWLGTFGITFSGGEPFLREDMVDILRFASKKDIIASVVSNGSLIDKTISEKLVSSGVDTVALSLNSLNPDVHNMTRGTDSNFVEVMSVIENLKQRGNMRLAICTTVVRENINDLVGLVEFVKSNGLDGINFQPLMEASIILVHDKDGKPKKLPSGKLYEELGKDMDSVDDAFEQLITMKEKGYPINNSVKHLRYILRYLKNPEDPEVLKIPCKIGPKNFFIDPFGNVRICQVMEPIGNIKDEAPQKIWNSEKAQRQREMIKNCPKVCSLLNCNFKELDLGGRAFRTLRSFKSRSA
jgi:MoaA/NifB/PqqE/SkfB family radical SAM enzyme